MRFCGRSESSLSRLLLFRFRLSRLPELPKYREEFRDIAKSDEDVLFLALFPQAAPKFLQRRDGPHEFSAAQGQEPPKTAPIQPVDPGTVRELYVEYRG